MTPEELIEIERVLAEVSKTADRLRDDGMALNVMVLALREAGTPWSWIAQELGITKQAAQQRWSA